MPYNPTGYHVVVAVAADAVVVDAVADADMTD